MEKQKILVIAGPTGVGKTKLAMQLYDEYNSKLISADSMQVYKGCDVGTAKLSKELQVNYPHALIDIKEINEEFSVAEFKEYALKEIEKAKNEKKLPIIVGGTGLYIEALLFPYDFRNTSKNIQLREYYYKLASENGNEFVYNILLKKNNEMAKSVHKNDLKRIIRMLEILENSEDNKSNTFEKTSQFDYNIIFLNKERDKLYDIINSRVDEMIQNGLEKEAKYVFQNARTSQVAKAIGYKEFFDYFEGQISLEEVINLIKQHSRNYAKRQITWFKRYSNILFTENNEELQKFLEENYKIYKK